MAHQGIVLQLVEVHWRLHGCFAVVAIARTIYNVSLGLYNAHTHTSIIIRKIQTLVTTTLYA